MWDKEQKINISGKKSKSRDIMVKVGFHEITILFCLLHCLFYSDYNKTN